MDTFSGYGNTTTTLQALPLRQLSHSPKWTDDNHQLTTPPPDRTTALLRATEDAANPRIATSVSSLSNSASTDWEAHKHIINELYMGQNLNLNEVVEKMKAHGFHATPRVYKAQFARWGWSKYNCKRMRRDLSSGKSVVKSQGKSCYRVKRQRATKANKSKDAVPKEEAPSPDAPARSPTPSAPSSSLSPTSSSSSSTATPAPTATTTTTAVVHGSSPIPRQSPTIPYPLAHVNGTARFIESILTDIRSHVYNVFTRQANWQQSRATKVGLIKAYDYLSYDHFVIAMDAFVKNEHSNGGEILRQAFLEVEEAIQTDYSSTFYFLFIDLPDLFLRYGRHDILTILLGHIQKLTGSVRLRDKISGTGFAALHALAKTDPSFLQHYISTASALWCDLLTELRGPIDRSTLLAKRNFLRHARGANTAYRVAQLCDDYTVLMDEVHKQFGPGHDMSQHMEDVVLSTQMIHDYFVDGFVDQNQRLIQSVEDKYRIVDPHTHSHLPPTVPSTTVVTSTITMSPPVNNTAMLSPTSTIGTNLPTSCPPTNEPTIPLDNTTAAIMTTLQSPSVIPTNDIHLINNSNTTTQFMPLEAWDVLDRNIRSNCYHRLAYFYSNQRGDAHRAHYYNHKASEGWRYSFWQLEAETALVWAGRNFEAESLRRCRLEAQYFGKLPESGQMIAAGLGNGGGVVVHHDDMGIGSAMGIDENLFVAPSVSPPVV